MMTQRKMLFVDTVLRRISHSNAYCGRLQWQTTVSRRNGSVQHICVDVDNSQGRADSLDNGLMVSDSSEERTCK